jgi:hypothetical protein
MHITIKGSRIHTLCGRVCHRYARLVTGCSTHVFMLSQYPYGYEQHTLAPPVGGIFAHAPPIMTPNHTAAEPVVVGGHNGYATVPPGQPLLYRNGVELDYSQPTSPTVEFNVDELLEYQRRRSSATSEEKEPLTPAQRRRKAQNRAAYVSRLSNLLRNFIADTSWWP